jgi:hypothetical protein
MSAFLVRKVRTPMRRMKRTSATGLIPFVSALPRFRVRMTYTNNGFSRTAGVVSWEARPRFGIRIGISWRA